MRSSRESKPSWNIQIYTVSEITSLIKQAVSVPFRNIIVEGEVSNAKPYPSGHLYFTLKDSGATIRAVMFNYAGRHLGDEITDGVAVICRGRIDVYEKRGEYQLIAEDIEIKGRGDLERKFRELKEKLFNEGLFDPDRKRPVPMVPTHIGIITSPAGAAIRDMLKVINRKFDNTAVTLYPARVQGDEASLEIIEGIEYFNRARDVDVIILGRGGGSLEDLAPFNDEGVARAICASEIPIISGIGHEIDFTIADFAADVRAPTPTAAADIAVRDKLELINLLDAAAQRLERGMKRHIEESRFRLRDMESALKEKKDIFFSWRMELDELANAMILRMMLLLKDKRNRAENLIQRLSDLNPENILKRGYSITVKAKTGEIIRNIRQVAVNDKLTVHLHKGKIDASVEGKRQR